MAKKILLLTDGFGPPLYNARVRFFADFLCQNGWQVKIATEKIAPLNFPHNYEIDAIELYHCSGFLGKFEWAVKSFLSLCFDYKNRSFSRKIRQKYANEAFDLVACSAFHTFPLRAASDFAHKKNIPLHLDIRDLAEQMSGHKYQAHSSALLRPFLPFFKKINIRRRNEIIRKANSVSSVSPWHVEFLQPFNANVSLAYNGYDSTIFLPKKIKNQQFTIVYAGKFYGQPMQDPELLFAALQKMKNPQIFLDWYTDANGQKMVQNLATKYGVEQQMRLHNYVQNGEVPALLQASSVVLVLTNKETAQGPHGIMTTKFFEALGVEKPVLCVRSDEACLAAAIEQTNAGIAAKTADEVVDFLTEKFAEWQANGFTHQSVNQEIKAKFSRQKQAEEFEKLLLSLL